MSFALKGNLTLLGSTGIGHVNQSDWDGESLAAGSAAYGNRSRERCLGIHSADGVLRETGEVMVYLLLLDGNAGRIRHHLKMWNSVIYINTFTFT